jgi:RHS repeat-associated protein
MTDGRHLTTKEYDADAGMHYFANRWFDSTSGTFISRDPTQNPYHWGFPADNPVMQADPTGFGNDYKTATRAAQKCGLTLVEGGDHTLVKNAAGQLITQIPRHTTIDKWTLKSILKKIAAAGTCAGLVLEFVLCPNTAYAPEMIGDDEWPTAGPGIFPVYDPSILPIYRMSVPQPDYWEVPEGWPKCWGQCDY